MLNKDFVKFGLAKLDSDQLSSALHQEIEIPVFKGDYENREYVSIDVVGKR